MYYDKAKTSRCARDRVLEMVESGELSAESLNMMFVKWNTGDDIEEMLDQNEISLWHDGRWNEESDE